MNSNASRIAAMMVAAGMDLSSARIYGQEGILPAGSALAHEGIALANDTQFVESNYSRPLTTYVVGWADNSDLMSELDFLFPPVQVPRRFSYKSATNAEEFLEDSADEDIREIGSEFKYVKDYTSSEVNAATLNKGLTIKIDLDRVADQANWREIYTARLMGRLLRAELRRGLALINAASVNTAKTWGSSADPDQDVMTQITNAADISGVKPNRVYYGESAWTLRRTSFRQQNTAGGFAGASLNETELASYLGVDRVLQSGSRYQSSASAKTQFGGSRVFLFNAMDGASERDASNAKRFWTPCTDGTMVRVYEQQVSAKIYQITVEHYSLPRITSTLGIRKLTIS
jgi:hypothetical protein